MAVSSDGVDAGVEVIYMREGKILGSDHFIMQRAEAQEEESLAMFLLQYYDNAPYIPKEILLGEAVEDLDVMEKLLTEKKGARVHILVPQRGDKKKLVDMARKNAEDIAAVRGELGDLKADLPLIYTTREDFIRVSNNIDQKLDKLLYRSPAKEG